MTLTLSASDVARFHADGFLLGPRVLDDAAVDELRAELDHVIERFGQGWMADPATVAGGATPQPVAIFNLGGDSSSPVWQIVNIWQASDAFRRLLFNPAVTAPVAQLTEARHLRIWHDQVQYKPAGRGGPNRWHQDAPLWPVLTPMTEVSAWVALDDVDEGNGCMRMVRGSHRWGDQMQAVLSGVKDVSSPPASFEGRPVEVVTRPVPKGHVHYHHALTWHASGRNPSDRPRRAIALHFMTDETRFVAGGQHLMKPFIAVGDGELVEGPVFPVVFDRGMVPSTSSSSSSS